MQLSSEVNIAINQNNTMEVAHAVNKTFKKYGEWKEIKKNI